MNYTYREGSITDLPQIKSLAIKSWGQFQSLLTPENWQKLYSNLINNNTYKELLETSKAIICTSDNDKIIGMAFLVPNGNPTEIYDKDWCYIRFGTVDPEYGGQGIGRQLTRICIENARQHNERLIALHTSEIMNAARHLYESLGFAILKEIDQRLGKRYWLYTLELGGLI
jgi:ribosomal protein S18 acetylase RimI-like enzyme